MAINDKVWLISGCSSGLGESIARAVLAAGQKAIVTCRGDATKRLASLVAAGASAMSLDVTASSEELEKVVRDAHQVYGRLDVLVNNAGYVLQGVFEELMDEELAHQYETNVFGVFRLTRAVLPFFRAQKSGVILNVSSHCGRFSRPAFTGYSGSKWALEAFSEGLAAEVRDLGISVCAVEPGDFRTKVLSGGSVKVPAADGTIAEYRHFSEENARYNRENDGKQRGDPDAAGRVIVALANDGYGRGIPVRLALGGDSYENIKQVYEAGLDELKAWRDVSESTDFA